MVVENKVSWGKRYDLLVNEFTANECPYEKYPKVNSSALSKKKKKIKSYLFPLQQ